MILNINRLELDFSNAMYLKAEDFIDQKNHHLKLLDKNLWSLSSNNPIQFEVEILKKGREKFKVNCDCSEFNTNKKCAHVLAAMILWKSESIRLKVENQKMSSKKPKSFNLRSILDTISHEELSAFVQNYAKTNSKFSIALKSNFARKLNLADNSLKYKFILDSIIRPKSTISQKLSASKKKLFFDTIYDFHEQFGDCIALKNYQESYCILKVIHAKCEYVKYHFLKNEPQLISIIQKNYNSYQCLFNEELAPELTKQIVLDLVEFTDYTYLNFDDHSNNVFRLLIANQLLNQKQKERIKKQLRLRIPFLQNDQQWSLVQAILIQLNKSILPLTDFENINLNALILCSQYLFDQNEITLALELNQEIKNRYGSNLAVLLLDLELYKVNQNSKKIISSGLEIFENTRQSKSIVELQPYLNKSEYESILSKIEDSFLQESKHNYCICELLCIEQRKKMLSKKLRTLDFDTFQPLIPLISKLDEDAAFQIYWNAIDRYLENHLGEETQQKVNQIFSHLRISNKRSILQKLNLQLNQKYSERKTELNI